MLFFSPEKPFGQFAALFFFGHQGAKFHHQKKNPGPDHNRVLKFILISSILSNFHCKTGNFLPVLFWCIYF
jgi:hypothetical protein